MQPTVHVDRRSGDVLRDAYELVARSTPVARFVPPHDPMVPTAAFLRATADHVSHAWVLLAGAGCSIHNDDEQHDSHN